MNKTSTPYLILGAGPAGLAAGYRLTQSGAPVLIVERGNAAGGLMRGISRGPYKIDFGRKELYDRIPEVTQLWHSLLGEDFIEYDYRIGILYKGHVFEKTSTYRGVMRGMPLGMFINCGLDFLAQSIIPKKITNYQDFMYKTRGRRFSQIFLQGYLEKFDRYSWESLSVPTSEDTEVKKVANSRDFITRSVKDSSDSKFKQAKWRHPAEGSGQIIKLLEQNIKDKGGEIWLGANIKKVNTEGKEVKSVIVEKNGELTEIIPEHVISSLPIEILGQLMGLKQSPSLQQTISFQRGTIIVNLFLDEAPRFSHIWLNVSCPDLRVGRVTNYAAQGKRMVPPGKTALCMEYFLQSNDPLFGLDSNAIKKMAIEEASQSGLIDPSLIEDSMVMKFPNADAAVSWEDYFKDPSRNVLFDKIKSYSNLLNANRPGTDRATHAGLVAGECLLSRNKAVFEELTNPREAQPWISN